MCAEQRKPKTQGRIAAFGKVIWYCCATILVLSLPTFSYLLPDLKVPFRGSFPSFFGSYESEPAQTEYQYQRLEGRVVDSPDGADKSGRGFVSSQSGFGTRRSVNQSSGPREVTRVSAAGRTASGVGTATSAAGVAGAAASRTGSELGMERALSRELSLMEDDYQDTMNSLYSGVGFAGGFGGANPFSKALNDSDSTGDNGDNGNNGTNGDSGDSSSGDGSGGDGPGGDGQGTDGGDNGGGDTPPPNPEPTGPNYSFLVLSEPGTLGPGVATRAYSDGSGSLTLEDGTVIEVFSGVVSFPRAVYIASDGQMLAFNFLDGDSLVDVVAANPWSQGVQLQTAYHVGDGWVIGSQLSQAFHSVTTLAAFDTDADGEKELVVCFDDDKLLTIFEISEGEIAYKRDLVLPFNPAILVSTDDRLFKTGYLHVWDASLKRAVLFSTRYPGAYSYSKPSTYEGLETVALDPPVPGGEVFGLLRYQDRLVVTTYSGTAHRFVASLARAPELPLTVIGDYSESGTREVIVLP